MLSDNSFSLVSAFLSALKNTRVYAVPVVDMEEVVVRYHKSGGGMPDVLNTIPALGEVNIHKRLLSRSDAHLPFYQTWVSAALAVAESGAIFLAKSSVVDSPVPVACEHLIVILDATDILPRLPAAGADNLRYGAYFPNDSDTRQPLVVGSHRAGDIAVYIIEDTFRYAGSRVDCGPDCACWHWEAR